MVATTNYESRGNLATITPVPAGLEEEHSRNASVKWSLTDESSRRTAGQFAKKAIERLLDGSSVFQEKNTPLQVSIQDVQIGDKILGKGGFCQVQECTYKGKSHALKRLKASIISSNTPQQQFNVGAADLATEARFLHALNHPHIIQAHGVLKGEVEDNAGEYFIIIDKLHETLEDRIYRWKKQEEVAHHRRIKSTNRKQQDRARTTELIERLKIALQIADVLQYLQEKGIIYRDLKPENIGFDEDGQLKLFDFGLAKELKNDNRCTNGKYKLSGNTGSQSYMAPEIAKGWKYDASVDVYSFAIVLWEICAMDFAFDGWTREEFVQRVVDAEVRPPLEDWWPVELKWLMKKCWSFFSSHRPGFGIIQETLQEIILHDAHSSNDGHDDDDDSENHHTSSNGRGGIQSLRFVRRMQHHSGENDEKGEDPRQVQSHRMLNRRDLLKKVPSKPKPKHHGSFRLFGHRF